jgi:hypothetical protein
MISAAQWKAYNDAVASITDTARATVTAKVREWLNENPGASTAEARDAAERILKSYSGVYSQQAATLAAEWYDAQGKAAGAKLDRAVTSATVDEDSLRRTVRYQARLLEDGGGDFAAAVGEWAENAAKRAVNDTVLANAKRDRRKGVRFARVTSGRNTCAFCLMLAGRGAVYHTRETAGEFNRYHRHCSCKIVPSYSGDQYEVLVEGHGPKEMRALRGLVLEVDQMDGILPAQKQAAKGLLAGNIQLGAARAVSLASRLDGAVPPVSTEVREWSSGKKFAAHAKKHAAAFGFDYTTQEGRDAYDALFSATMDSYDAVAFDSNMGGQSPDACAFYFDGDTVAIVNTVTARRVSLFKHERGASEYIDRIWDKAHG